MPDRNDSSSTPPIFNSNTHRGASVTTLVLKTTKIFLKPYNQQLRNETTNHTRGHMNSYKRIIQPKTHTSMIWATKHQANCIRIATIRLHIPPNAEQEKLIYMLCQSMILLLLNIMTIVKVHHSRNIIESYYQTTRNKHIRVSNQQIYTSYNHIRSSWNNNTRLQ